MHSSLRELSDKHKISCTTKGLKALIEDPKLKGRERQYCLLLSRGDEMSHLISAQLRQKVDLEYLLNQGYIEVNVSNNTDDSEELTIAPTIDTSLEDEDSMVKMTDAETPEESDVDAVLRIVAGNI